MTAKAGVEGLLDWEASGMMYSVCPTPVQHVWVHTASQVVALSFISWAVKWGYWYLLLPLNQKRQFYVKES